MIGNNISVKNKSQYNKKNAEVVGKLNTRSFKNVICLRKRLSDNIVFEFSYHGTDNEYIANDTDNEFVANLRITKRQINLLFLQPFKFNIHNHVLSGVEASTFNILLK